MKFVSLNPWHGCHKCSEGCKFCYIHKGDAKRGVNTDEIRKFQTPVRFVQKYVKGDKAGQYKVPGGLLCYLCFHSDFLLEDADQWRAETWDVIRERKDLNFLFLTKRIDRFMKCVPEDWGDGWDNVIVGCTVENQKNADYKLSIFDSLPIKHKVIIVQPMLEKMDISLHLKGIESVDVGGESDRNARPLDFDWVLDIRRQCIDAGVKFNFRQCGSHFIKDGKMYNLHPFQLMEQAAKANINI
ncbi:MAG: DUF5131 family protein [Treponema sp.]|nr:DUF5131 family protein [Treponema sp.]